MPLDCFYFAIEIILPMRRKDIFYNVTKIYSRLAVKMFFILPAFLKGAHHF